MKLSRKTWAIIGFAIGGLLTVLGPFTPGTFCMDSCSSTPPNLHMIIVGITLLLVTFILRKPPKIKGSKKRGVAVGFSIGCGGILLFLVSLNGWVIFMLLMPLLSLFVH